MVSKMLKLCLIVVISVCIVGGLLFGKDLVSYLRSSARSVQTAVKGSIPIEFELRRARDLIDDIIPEMHANIRLIAQEEVEVVSLKSDIETSQESIAQQRGRLAQRREALDKQFAGYTLGGRACSREELTEDLAGMFERFKEAELALASKRRLLAAREKSLAGAMELLERTRARKRVLEDKVSSLQGQYRLLQAASVGSRINLDNSKLAQSEKLINQIKKRLDVAERVLTHESRFVQTAPREMVGEAELLEQIDEYLCPDAPDDELAAIERSAELCQAKPLASQATDLK